MLCFFHRGLHPLLWRQHVYEGGDAYHHAHWGRGRLSPFSFPEGLWPPHGHHLSRVSWHAEARAGWGSCQTHSQLRYRILPSPTPPICLHISTFTMRQFTPEWLPVCPLTLFLSFCQIHVSYFSLWFLTDFFQLQIVDKTLFIFLCMVINVLSKQS